MRLASFNVENLFAPPKAMDERQGDAATRKAVLAAHARISALFEQPSYAGVADEILHLLEKLGLLRSDAGPYAVLRKVRGQLVRRPRDIFPTLTAKQEEASDHAAIYADLIDF